MKGSWCVLVIVLVAACCSQTVLAQSGSIKLLALAEVANGTQGDLAQLTLDIRPGKERVFLETVPLSKVATQISMRFAQQQACKALRYDCSDRDFIYTINAQPGLVGGPSAGAAAAVLTASLLGNYRLRDDVAMTGTINSGNMIGPVGGIREKLEAAQAAGIRTVLVPMGSRVSLADNETESAEDWGDAHNLSVVEVATLEDALFVYANVNISRTLPPLTIDPAYQERMRAVASLICNRTIKLAGIAASEHNSDNDSADLLSEGRNSTLRAADLIRQQAYYSAASYCFRANVDLNLVATRARNESRRQLGDRMRSVFGNIAEVTREADNRTLITMTDLQTFMSVQERLLETADALVDAGDSMADNRDAAEVAIVYAEERLASAKSWMAFFGLPGGRRDIDQAALERSCYQKISEAEERFSYVRTYFPDALMDTRRDLDRAEANAGNKSFALCLGLASKAKAEADVILSSTGFENSQIDGLIRLKLALAQRSLVQAQQDGWFPLVGYNYYQYASDLRTEDPYSSLLFSEYALELGDTDLYFQPSPSVWHWLEQPVDMTVGALIVLIIALLAVGMAAGRHRPRATTGTESTKGIKQQSSPSSRKKTKPSPTPLAGRRRGKKR
jgi:uncharacterized protein